MEVGMDRDKNLIAQATSIKNISNELLNKAERVESNLYNASSQCPAEEKKPMVSGLEDILSVAIENLGKLGECLSRIDGKVGKIGSE